MTTDPNPSRDMLDVFERYRIERQRERDARVAEQWTALSSREQRLVREAAVMGFVQGEMFGRGRTWHESEAEFPRDAEIVRRVLEAVSMFAPHYPTLRRLGTRKRRKAEREAGGSVEPIGDGS